MPKLLFVDIDVLIGTVRALITSRKIELILHLNTNNGVHYDIYCTNYFHVLYLQHLHWC